MDVQGRADPPAIAEPDATAWDRLVAAAGGSVFHTSAWARLWCAEWPDARWQALTIPGGHGYSAGLGMIVRPGALGERILAMPFGTYGGPLVATGHPDPAGARRRLLAGYAARARAGRVLISSLTWYDGRRDELPPGLDAIEGFSHVRALQHDFEAVLRSLAHSVRKNVRQAEEHGLVVRPAAGPEDVAAYHALAAATVGRRGGRPQPLSLYRRIFERLVPARLARFDLVLHQDRPIAGALHLLHGTMAFNWLTVSDHQHWHLRPNHLLIARVLRELCAAGFTEYHLGGSPSDAEGLVRFKETWGGTRRPVLEVRHRSLLHRMFAR